MVLLGWDILRPNNSLAAIRYPSLVRVSSIHVYPTGARPFSQSPETVALTEPSAFFLDVLFNASIIPSSNQDSQDKRTAKNALAPTRIAYTGGATEFVVNMGDEYATRLIIFRGDFEVVSVAIYGEVVAEPHEVQSYQPGTLIAPIPSNISPNIDVANSVNPAKLAEKLIALLPVPPPLPLACRLVFSLKPEVEDWDHPDFPHLYTDLEEIDQITDLEGLVRSMTRPIRDDISPDALSRFAAKVHDLIGHDPSDDAYYVAKLLVKASSQQKRICLTILQHLDLPAIFNEDALDDATIDLLLDAVSNVEIARNFLEDEKFFSNLVQMQLSPKTEKKNAKALKKLISRIRGWQSFENALANVNVNGDFSTTAAFLKDVTSDEHSLGCWLECMLIYDNLTSKLNETTIPASPQTPPLLFQERHTTATHPEFMTFVRALLGISTVLAALSWSDSIGSIPCRERALGLLVLWQGVDGYREIINHCFLLRQLTKRLGWNQTVDVPTKSGNFAERLLVGLVKDPQAMLHEQVVEIVLSLEEPFSFIESEELMEIEKLARVGRDGVSSAIEELTYSSVRPFSLRRLRVLRVSLALLEDELGYDDGLSLVTEKFWDEKGQGLVPTLISILVDLTDDINRHFVIQPIPRMNQGLCELLFRTADDLLRLLERFICLYPPTSRDLGHLTASIADLYACSRIACERFTTSSAAYQAAKCIRQTCIQIPHTLVNDDSSNLNIPAARTLLRILFTHASRSSDHDPAVHVLQTYDLVDTILPQPSLSLTNGASHSEPSLWTTMVFPKILSDMRNFWNLLDVENRVHFLERLEGLDHGETGIGEWLLTEEMKDLSARLVEITGLEQFREGSRTFILYAISTGISFFEYLVTSPAMASWTLSALTTNTDLSQLLDGCLSLILDANIYSKQLTQLMRRLGEYANDFSPDARFHILLLILRNAQIDPSATDSLAFVPGILKSLPSSTISVESLRSEVGRTIAAYADRPAVLDAHNAEMLLSILEWLSSQADPKLTIIYITLTSFQHLCISLSSALPPERQEAIKTVETKLSVDEDNLSYLPTELPDTLVIPLDDIEHIFAPKSPQTPSTPKRGTKTPDILGVVISPPTALLRSPAATGLTKTYANNDFRQLRQATSARLNTSRLPSTHVDDFEHAAAMESPPGLLAAASIELGTELVPPRGIFPLGL